MVKQGYTNIKVGPPIYYDKCQSRKRTDTEMRDKQRGGHQEKQRDGDYLQCEDLPYQEPTRLAH